MNKTQLAESIMKETGLSEKAAKKAVSAVLDSITNALKEGDKVQLAGFGTFEVRQRAERKGRNPATNAEITIPASKVPAFKAGKTLKDTIA